MGAGTSSAIKAARHHTRAGRAGLSRDLRVLVSARSTYEYTARNKLQFLLSNERMWLLLRDDRLTVRLRLQAMQSISKGLAQLERLLIRPHLTMKFQVLLIIENPEVIQELRRVPHCLWPR